MLADDTDRWRFPRKRGAGRAQHPNIAYHGFEDPRAPTDCDDWSKERTAVRISREPSRSKTRYPRAPDAEALEARMN